ncbi:MAG: SIS domain-containing protein [Dongiaceae bacterium]
MSAKPETQFLQHLDEHIELAEATRALAKDYALIAETCAGAILQGKKILFCGNGGSAADAQHWAAELVSRLRKERSPMPALALTTDTSALTAILNDYGADQVFSKQIEALANPGDILLGITTSGNSANIIRAFQAGRSMGTYNLLFTGNKGGKLLGELAPLKLIDRALVVASNSTMRIQEMHILLAHSLCAHIEDAWIEKHGAVGKFDPKKARDQAA